MKNINIIVLFCGFNCNVKLTRYTSNNRIAISLTDSEDHGSVAVATLNDPDTDLAEDEVIIKNYSENEGILETLIEAGVISKPVRITKFSNFPVCKLLIPHDDVP